MGVFDSEWLRPAPTRPAREWTSQLLAAVALILFTAYVGATLAGAPRETSSFILGIDVFPDSRTNLARCSL